jgi:hypothetical protein
MSGVVSGITTTPDSAWALSKLNTVIGMLLDLRRGKALRRRLFVPLQVNQRIGNH